NTGDALLDSMLDVVNNGRKQVEQMMEILARNDLPEAQREQAGKLLEEIQTTLGANILIATDYMVSTGIDINAGQAASGAVAVLSESMRSVTSTKAKGQLKTNLEKA